MLSGLIKNHRMSGKAAALCGLALLATLSGCGKSDPWKVVHPAKGIVTYKGKPVAEAAITLIPQDANAPETVRPQAKSAEDGTFQLWTYEKGDGAPSGSYKVVIVHYPITRTDKGDVIANPNDLPKKYASPVTTDLVVEVAEGKTELPPFDLK
ncbi:hypothetical protein SH661x_002003 [Planctomicrobium sp. SH661]|uniref:hypothetical protein n=1 Tax=Planctomicrobium sp. SH661 TaxID=3448124 RepID=UPI003F5CAE74